jgi:hypothetical protein
VLDFVDETFHKVTLPIKVLVVLGGFSAPRSGWYYRYPSSVPDLSPEVIRIVGRVPNGMFKGIASDEGRSLGDVMALPAGQDKPQSVPQGIKAHMDLGAEPPSAATQSLGLLAPFFGSTRGAGMSPHNGAVDDQVFQVRVIGEVMMHSFPDAFLAPAGKPLVDGVPVAIGLGQQSPGGAAAGHPEDSFNEAPTLGRVANVDIWTGLEKLEYFRPLVVA